MKKEDLLALLRQYMGTAGELGDKLIAEIMRKLNSGVSLTQAIDKALADTGFSGQYFDNLLDTISKAALLGYGIKSPSMEQKKEVQEYLLSEAWAPDKMKLSERLHGTSKQMRTTIVDTIATAMRKGKAVTQMAMDLYDGYNSGKKVLRGAELPEYLQRLARAARSAADGDLTVTRDFNLALKRAKKQLEKMEQPDKALKVAYSQLIKAAEDLNTKAIEKAVWVAVQEKARYYADRIAITESANAWSDMLFARSYDDPLVIGYGWRLSTRHPRVDICDFHAKVDHYGMGAGNYPKDKMPPHPAHPFCTCNLIILYKGDAEQGKFNPNAGTGWLKEQSEAVRKELLGFDGNKSFDANGQWQNSLRNWQGHKDPRRSQAINNAIKLDNSSSPLYTKDDDNIKKYYHGIAKNEPQITQAITKVVERAGGTLEGLEYRIKTLDSFIRKVDTDYDIALSEGQKITKLQISGKINDVIRYTAIQDVRSLYGMYKETMQYLQNMGYSLIKVKNTWNDALSAYKGVNTVLKSPTGQAFELQFHTPESFDMKQNKLHKYYEELRKPSTPFSRKQELSALMLKMSQSLEKPVDIDKIR